jgi:hypothetical protein
VSSDIGNVDRGVTSAAFQDRGICVHYGGHCYVTTRERAASFLRRVQQLTERGASELVPLLHSEGIELLFIASNVPLQVHDMRDRSLDRSHSNRAHQFGY